MHIFIKYFFVVILLYLINLHSTYLESIHKIKKYKDTPTKDIEKSIKGWLAQAPSRIKKRTEKKNTTYDNDDNN